MLLDMSCECNIGTRHAFPDFTEYPPMPLGHASVMVTFVGWRMVIKLKLMPLLAWLIMLIQCRSRVSVALLNLSLQLSCFPSL